MAKDAYYFSHDSNAKDDPKCMLLIEELQLEGYGIYWLLVEVLREQENYKYPLRMVPVLARKFLTTKEKMLAVIYKYDLFVVENEEFFYSESLNRRMGLMNNKREQARLAGKKSGEARRNKALEYKKEINTTSTDVQQTFNDSSTDAEQLKESKLKEKKEKEIKINNFFEECWNLYPKKEGIASVSFTKKTELFKLGEELKRAVNRYKDKIETEKTEKKYIKQGSTFFNSGYVDYLDNNFIEENTVITIKEFEDETFKENGIKLNF